MNIYYKINHVIITLILLIITGCSSSKINIFGKLFDLSCPSKPTKILLEENVQQIDLEAEKLIVSSKINTNQNIGYVFPVRAGQKLNYQTNQNTCLWIFTPENDLLNSPKNKTVSNLELAQSGTYIIQISTIKSWLNSELNINLGLSRKEAVSVLENWYREKEQILGQTFDNQVLNQYTTGKFNERTLNTVSEIAKTKCYYTFKETTIEEVVSFNNIPQRPVLVVKVYEEYERYSSPKFRKCPQADSPYRATITYWLEQDNQEWKIYNSELKNDS